MKRASGLRWFAAAAAATVVALALWRERGAGARNTPRPEEHATNVGVRGGLTSPPLPPTPAERESVSEAHDGARAEPASRAFIHGIVVERSGAPIEGAECELRGGRPPGGFVAFATDEARPATVSTRSGADGRFRLEAGPGFWSVAVQSPGFARWERDHLVASDELRVRLDPEVLLLVTVVDESGAPVADAEVLVREADEESPARARFDARTDSGGGARIAGLAPGAWSLTVEHPGHAVVAVPLEVPAGSFRIEREVRLARGARVVGTVRSEVGAPVPLARVRIAAPNSAAFLAREVVCDADGRYETPALFGVRETLEVLATAEGYAESTVLLGIQPEHVRAGEVVVDVVLAAAARTLVGRAVDAGAALPDTLVRIAALDPVGTSPEDVLMAVQSAPSAPWLWQEAARTDDAGEFELTGLSASPQYVLLLVHPLHAPRMVWVPSGAPGTTTRLGDVELARFGSLFGRARHDDGTPTDGERLVAYLVNRVRVESSAGLGAWRPAAWCHPLETRVREDGSFRFDLLAPGSWELVGEASGRFEVESGRATGPVEVVIGRARSAATVAVSGTVRDRSGRVLSEVFVRAFELAGGSERLLSARLAGADGAFALSIPAEHGARLRFTDFGGACADQELVLAPPFSSAPLDVVLEARTERLPALDGLVLGPRGEPVEGCAVTLRPPEDSLCGCIAFHAKTDAAGAFRFEHVSDGPHRLIVSDARFETALQYPAHAGDHVLIELRAR